MADAVQKPGNAAPAKKAATGAFTPAGVSPSRRSRHKYTIRLWAVRNSRFFEWFYNRFAQGFLLLHPVWKLFGYQRVERPITFVERHVKGFLFDCRMCGQCALSSTGMSCPMNCPKQLRNGPCGGDAGRLAKGRALLAACGGNLFTKGLETCIGANFCPDFCAGAGACSCR